ncbi:15-hydroxyprostaglandin dehydrogenase [Corynespora cassiicola Philippines]|uniref:15-hydroxyprostaglandin dehydrogenase n=1 Tax=Corynespora cassiicola Philippines TaxID=1448308 RepID=A0A2T2NY07_CORCC|nr:15-hydroxyprostaglandin dehydrogenase [Corynespora cassiicola Philippines]
MVSPPRVAIVTGGNSGIGTAIVQDLLKRGWKVAIADIKENKELVEELGEAVSYHHCDVADYYSQAIVFQQVWDMYGRIDALCANAGIVDQGSIFVMDHRGADNIPPKPDLSCTDVDYKGVIYGVQLAIHFMRKNKVPGGKIVVTASVAGIMPLPTYPEYDGAKAAVVNFVRATAPILKQKENISFNCIAPGIVHTKIAPKAMIDAVPAGYLTPVDTVVAAYVRCLDDASLVGKTIECSVDKQFFIDTPKLGNGPVSERAVAVWDPLFKIYHKESSDLADAVY